MRAFDSCLNNFDCWYNLDHDTKQKCLRITDLIIILISTCLWILFVILFATKHESSSSFILFGVSNLSTYEVKYEISVSLSKKFHVNDLKVSSNGGQFTAVFSLRDNQKILNVQKYINDISSDVLKNIILTDGSSSALTCVPPSYLPIITSTVSTSIATSSSSPETTASSPSSTACPPSITSSPPSTTSSPPSTTSSPPSTTSSSSSTISSSSSTISSPSSTTASPPGQTNFYCSDNDLQRDIVIVVDFLSVEDDRQTALLSLKQKLNSGFNFGPTRIFLMGADSYGSVNVSTDFISTEEKFNNDWDYMMGLNMDNGMYQISTDDLFNRVAGLPFRQNVPRAIFMLIAHDMKAIAIPENDLAKRGYFVAVARTTMYELPEINKIINNGLMAFDNWNSMAAADPFSRFTCQFVWTNNSLPSN